jgi:hypothetical protein
MRRATSVRNATGSSRQNFAIAAFPFTSNSSAMASINSAAFAWRLSDALRGCPTDLSQTASRCRLVSAASGSLLKIAAWWTSERHPNIKRDALKLMAVMHRCLIITSGPARGGVAIGFRLLLDLVRWGFRQLHHPNGVALFVGLGRLQRVTRMLRTRPHALQ